MKLEEYGRPKIDGELKVCSIVNRTKQDRYDCTFIKGFHMQQKTAFDLFCYKQIIFFSLFSVPRYIFLFDKVVIVCKRKGYSYELKEIIELHFYKMSDDPMNNRDIKKVRGL